MAAASSAVTSEPSTPSWATGEFYVALAPLVIAVATMLTGHAVSTSEVTRELTVIGTIAAGMYSVARTVLKMVHARGAAQLAIATVAASRPASLTVTTSGVGAGGGGSVRIVDPVKTTAAPRKRPARPRKAAPPG